MASVIQRKPKFKTELVVALDSFVSSALPSGPFAVAAGTRLKADHPIVAAVPSFFVEDGTDDAKIQSMRTALYMASMPPPNPPAPVAPVERRIPDEDALVNIFNGERVAKGSPEAKQRPADHVPVVPPGLSRRDALIALTSMRQIGEGGKPERVVHANTWVARDDEFVRLHPHNFAPVSIAEAVPAPTARHSTRTEA
jgi:hypothetical protein